MEPPPFGAGFSGSREGSEAMVKAVAPGAESIGFGPALPVVVATKSSRPWP